MSYTAIYAFGKDGNAFFYGQIANAWRGAMAIWRTLEERYLPTCVPSWVKARYWFRPDMPQDELIKRIGYKPSRLMSGGDPKDIWELAQNPDVSMTDRIVLYTTYDKALVKKEDLPKVIDAFRKFDGVSSLPEQAEILEVAYNDPDVFAIGWDQNSTVADNWGNHGGYDENRDEEIPYNYLSGEEHFWIFDELEV